MATASATEQQAEPPQPAPADKFPELRAALTALQAERDRLTAQTDPLRSERDKLLAGIQPTLRRIRELEQQYRVIEQPRLAEIDNQISALARATGGRAMSRPEVATRPEQPTP